MKTIQSLSNLFLSTLTKKSGFFIFYIVISICSVAQTPIQGIVNTYHKVNSIDISKACIIVEDPTGLNLNNLVMIVQMKGATITTDNDPTYGTVSNLNNAGNYEIGTICFIKDDSVFLFHQLQNSYSPVDGKVQLVQFADDISFNVVNTVTALPWDSATGLGGVIAIHADLSITLNAGIDASTSGYMGGPLFESGDFCNNSPGANGYVYNGTPAPFATQNGARKGEGVAFVSSIQSGGRGAPANGGGGGNNHNNSGGGGGNLVSGGLGGGNSSSTGCFLTFQGIGGRALLSSGGQKIFMGGGGGAGHNNNNAIVTTGGANGGGIIFIWANSIIGNSQSIRANGGNGGNSLADGAGGGGAGGTVIMHITDYTSSPIVEAKGGGGGNSNDGGNIRQCFGGGGGGSGGAIYFTGPIPAITTSTDGGLAGAETGRDPDCNPPQAAQPGSNGNIFSSYIFTRSTNPAAYCRFLLPVKLIDFNASLINKKVEIDWIVENPELAKYYSIEKINSNNERTVLVTIVANDVQRIYSTIDNNPSPGNNLYRLKIIEKDNSITYSEYRSISLPYPANEYSVYPNPATNKITINGNFVIPTTFKLSDISGKLILQQQLSGNTIPIALPVLSPGIYLIRIGEKTQKLIIH
ncbi:hypothetical protein CAP36_09930 [Chitinophagaceae bacterium IBVUCB2]|nr:hypothetical protein CAP36_09930 [Chitinophagaceae bacterium IBVUCB2]